MKTYVITRVINNNTVCSYDESGNEIILKGKGVGFQKKAGAKLTEREVETVFKLDKAGPDNKLVELLKDIPSEYIEVSTEIIEHASGILGKKLDQNIYVTLTDHIHFSVVRKEKQLEYVNPLLWEIKTYYPREFQEGIRALEVIKERLGIELKEDEAGFIALHLVNAQLGTHMDSMYQITEMIRGVLQIVESYYEKTFDVNSLDYERFITHLKFFGQRLFKDKAFGKEDPGFHSMIRERYAYDYECANRIRRFVSVKYRKEIGDEEMTFLTVHLRRISSEEFG